MQISASAMSSLRKKKLATAIKNWKTSLDGKFYFTRFCKFVPNIFWLVVDSRAIYTILRKKNFQLDNKYPVQLLLSSMDIVLKNIKQQD